MIRCPEKIRSYGRQRVCAVRWRGSAGKGPRQAAFALVCRVIGRVVTSATTTDVPEISRVEPVESSGITLTHLPIKVNRQAAEKIAGVQGTPNLRFMPHWVYHYVSSGEQIYRTAGCPLIPKEMAQ